MNAATMRRKDRSDLSLEVETVEQHVICVSNPNIEMLTGQTLLLGKVTIPDFG